MNPNQAALASLGLAGLGKKFRSEAEAFLSTHLPLARNRPIPLLHLDLRRTVFAAGSARGVCRISPRCMGASMVRFHRFAAAAAAGLAALGAGALGCG